MVLRKSVFQKRLPLEFTLASGTSDETTIKALTVLSNSDTYDVLLGNEFLGPVFGMLDPLYDEFTWRSERNDLSKMPTCEARLSALCGEELRQTRYALMCTMSGHLKYTTQIRTSIEPNRRLFEYMT